MTTARTVASRSALAWSLFALVACLIAAFSVAPSASATSAGGGVSAVVSSGPDVAAPVLGALDFLPASVNLDVGTKSVTVTAHLTDATGVVAPVVVLDSDMTTQTVGLGSMSLSSGTTTDGVWTKTLTFPATAAAGDWTVMMYPLTDTLGNTDNTYHYNPGRVDVTNSSADSAPPALQSFTFSPTKVNVSASAQSVTVSVRLTDTTGASAPTTMLESEDRTQTLGLGEMSLVSGTPQDGLWTRTITVPMTAAPGGWRVRLLPLVDTAGNSDQNGRVNQSGLSVSATPPAVPAGPEAPTIESGDGRVTVYWPTPAAHESDIISYSLVSQPDGQVRTFAPAETAFNFGQQNQVTLTDLTIGTTHRFTVTATNAIGAGPASAASRPVVATHVPGRVTGLVASGGDHALEATWTVPTADGEPVTSYTITTVGAAGFPTTVSYVPATPGLLPGERQHATVQNAERLHNGSEYVVYVSAVNSAGQSTASDSVRVTPKGAPGMPSYFDATPGDGSVTVTWTPPLDDGGSPITGYTLTAKPRTDTTEPVPPVQRVGPETRSATFTGLTNGHDYDFTVSASNALGTGPDLPRGQRAVRPPDAPTGVTAVRGNGRVNLSWLTPAFDGGADILGYRVTAFPGGATAWANVETNSLTFTGLSNGTAYTFRVQAVTLVAGAGSAAVSASITPAGPPSAPGLPRAKPGKRAATISWVAPSANGASITAYQVTSSSGMSRTVGGNVLKLRFTGLKKGKRLTFRVRAVNDMGLGDYSAPTRTVRIK